MREPLAWRKSSYSASAANCVEVAWASPVVCIRDSKDVTKSPVHVSAQGWERFREAICADGAFYR
ncbi:DUF397 domain-containing protein [Streptomyces populi]